MIQQEQLKNGIYCNNLTKFFSINEGSFGVPLDIDAQEKIFSNLLKISNTIVFIHRHAENELLLRKIFHENFSGRVSEQAIEQAFGINNCLVSKKVQELKLQGRTSGIMIPKYFNIEQNNLDNFIVLLEKLNHESIIYTCLELPKENKCSCK